MSLANLAMSSLPELSIATPTICRPCEPYCCCISTSQGVSILQGPHQVAQKFSNTALPRRSESFMFPPSSFSSVKSGAGVDLPRTEGASGPLRRAMWKPMKSMTAATTATNSSAIGLRFFSGAGGCGGVGGLPMLLASISGVLAVGNWFGFSTEDIDRKTSLQSETIQEREPTRD